jgi:acetyl-CoA carboxylase carboxyltransferase component
MEGESAVMALFGPELDALKQQQRQPDAELQARVDAVRADYEHQLDARFAAARGFVDAVILPEHTRAVLAFALYTALHNRGPHVGAFGALPDLES